MELVTVDEWMNYLEKDVCLSSFLANPNIHICLLLQYFL
jgi:hypothetical protein